jgi:hypothetical protein
MPTSTGYLDTGITATWEEDRPVVLSITGRPHVIGSVTDLAFSPAYISTDNEERNGAVLNTVSGTQQPFDRRGAGYNKSLAFTGTTAGPGDCILKAKSKAEGADTDPFEFDTSGRSRLEYAMPLAFLATDPTATGDFFGVAYAGTTKVVHFVSEVVEANLPSNPKAGYANAPADLDDLIERFKRVQVDHIYNQTGQGSRPGGHMNTYGGSMVREISQAMLALTLDYTIEQKRPLMYAMIQYGLDLYYAMKQGATFWPVNGGHNHGRKKVIMFAAIMLNNATMKADIKAWAKQGLFQSDTGWRVKPEAGLPIWGSTNSADNYYFNQANAPSGTRATQDPRGWIDGGETPGTVYQDINAPSPIVDYLLSTMYDEWTEIWNHESLAAGYRLAEWGTWTLPDPQKPIADVADGGVDDCEGRYPALHGTGKMGSAGTWRPELMIEMYEDLVIKTPLMQPVISPLNTISLLEAEVTIVPFGYRAPPGCTDYRSQHSEIPADGTWPYISSGVKIMVQVNGGTAFEYTGPFTVDLDDVDGDGLVPIKAWAEDENEIYADSAPTYSYLEITGDPYTLEEIVSATSATTNVSEISASYTATPAVGQLLRVDASLFLPDADVVLSISGSGWTPLVVAASGSGTGTRAVGSWYKLVTGGSEPTAITVSQNGATARRMCIQIQRWSADPGFRATAGVAATANTGGNTTGSAFSTGTTAETSDPNKLALASWLGTGRPLDRSYSNEFIENGTINANFTGRPVLLAASKLVNATGTVESTATSADPTDWVSTGSVATFGLLDNVPPQVLGASVNAAGTGFKVTHDKATDGTGSTGYALTGEGNNAGPFTLGSPAFSEGDTVIEYTITGGPVNQAQLDEIGDPINGLSLTYTPGDIESASGIPLEAIASLEVTNLSEQGTAFATITAQITVDGEPDLTATMPFGLFDGEITIDTSKITVSQDGETITVTGVKQGFGLDGGGSNARIILNTDRPVYSSANGAVTITVAEGLFEDEGGNVSGPFFSEDVDNSSTQEPPAPPAPPAVVRRPRLTGGSAATFRVRIT